MHHMLLDYSGRDDAGWSDRAVAQINEGHRPGAAGLKEFKRLGLFLKDGSGKLIRIDDEKLDPVWQRCGELGMPVSFHVGDPKAFWLPYDDTNDRWTELKDHRSWWFGDPEKHPPPMELPDALNRVIERQPKTTFVCVHFANNPEDLDWVEQSLERYPNMYADMAARIWRVEVRIPLTALSESAPQAETRWKINLFRHDRSDNAFLAFSPPLKGSFHTPERFGWIEFSSAR